MQQGNIDRDSDLVGDDVHRVGADQHFSFLLGEHTVDLQRVFPVNGIFAVSSQASGMLQRFD